MFYGQCWKCGQRWELGTASTCTCPDEAPKREILAGWFVVRDELEDREWQGLTEKEQDAVFKTFSRSDAYKKDFLNRIASAIEAKLKEKNT